MNCPIDGTTLQMSERSGIEIDYCPQCRGVWLDRGELDKIIDRAEAQLAGGSKPSSSKDWERSERAPKKKKRTSFLSELFEGE
jgi:Zn-finger nucleic acid-binding protein